MRILFFLILLLFQLYFTLTLYNDIISVHKLFSAILQKKKNENVQLAILQLHTNYGNNFIFIIARQRTNINTKQNYQRKHYCRN